MVNLYDSRMREIKWKQSLLWGELVDSEVLYLWVVPWSNTVERSVVGTMNSALKPRLECQVRINWIMVALSVYNGHVKEESMRKLKHYLTLSNSEWQKGVTLYIHVMRRNLSIYLSIDSIFILYMLYFYFFSFFLLAVSVKEKWITLMMIGLNRNRRTNNNNVFLNYRDFIIIFFL